LRPRSKAKSTTEPGDRGAARFEFVGGKGGVGKTTCAAALAVAAARSGRRTLIISTDPAPSLGDALGRRLGPAPRSVAVRRGALHAVEIDSTRALDRWIGERREALERIALRGTWLDSEDVARLLRLSLPGIDEIAALFEIARWGRSPRFDRIVVDTAPTGHTLRMLAMPAALSAMARVFDHMQAKHRAMVAALRGGWTPDAEDALIEELDRDGRELAALLRDPARVRMSWVTIAEPMAVEETADAARALAGLDIPVARVIVNRLTPPPPARCGWCDARRTFERAAMRRLAALLPGAATITVAERDREPRGVTALAAIGAALSGASRPSRIAGPAGRGSRTWRSASTGRDAIAAGLAGPETRLLLFGGKGGVGKTTCAAAAAILVARRSPARRVLAISTDPAHSLGDALAVALSDRPRHVPGTPLNLRARELDAARAFRQVRNRYAGAIDALFDRIGRGASLDLTHDRQVMQDLIELAPPGIDELAAIIAALPRAHAASADDLVVMDTAPTGHALRLLEMPEIVQDWVKALMSILLKYQPIAGIGAFGEVLLKLSQDLGRLRALLADPQRAAFIVVTRPAALPRAETTRLLGRLRSMHIHVPAVIVNATGRGTCRRCRRAGAAERREIAALKAGLAKGAARPLLATAPAEIPPPGGASSLTRWARTWRRGT